mgnify:CR=1 FL=1
MKSPNVREKVKIEPATIPGKASGMSTSDIDPVKELRELLRENKTHPKVNYLVVHIFRIRMAIKTIQRAQKEANRENEHEVEPRATSSGGLS